MARALIPGRVLVQIRLMILLGSPPLARWRQLCDNLALPPVLVGEACYLLGDFFLLLVVVVDCIAVLRAGIGALSIESCGIVRAVEELEEVKVRDLGGVEDDLSGFGVFRKS